MGKALSLITLLLVLVSCHNIDDMPYLPDKDTIWQPGFQNPQLPAAPDTLRILLIGNSFAHDAVDYYFHDLCDEAGVVVMTGVMHISSCSLYAHLTNAQTDAPAYNFQVIDFEGKRTTVDNCRMSTAMNYADWDYVTLQQASEYSGLYYTYEASLPPLIKYVKQNAPEKAKICFHQTWAYSKECTRDVFSWYDNDQELMYECISFATRRAMDNNDLYMIIPSGTAIQNARQTSIGDNLTRDGFHLDLGIGRYIAACTWCEVFTGRSAVGLTITPEGVTEADKATAQMAAHKAVESPFVVTSPTNSPSTGSTEPE